MSGQGKTTLTKTIAIEWLLEVPNVKFLAWDHTIEWGFSHPNLHVFPSSEYALEEVCEIALELGDCNVIADEIDQEVSVHEGLVRDTPLHSIVNYGRHYNVGLLWCARRCPDVPRGLTANTNHWFVLHTDEPSDQKYIKGKLGPQAVKDSLALAPGHWFYRKTG